MPPRASLAAFLAVVATASSFHNGLNFPATHDNTNIGNFDPGVFKYDYTSENITNAKQYGVTGLRLGFNIETALDKTKGAAVLKKMRSFVDEMGAGILCMWDTLKKGQTGHGDGYVNNVTEAIQAWKNVAAAFNGSHVYYEIFNEPFGYKTVDQYYKEMTHIYTEAGLDKSKVIMDGMGYADSVKALSKKWDGMLAYHFCKWSKSHLLFL
jgi:hypothetical protein